MANPKGSSAGIAQSAGHDVFEGTAYRAMDRLRAGGMGEVWHVEHRKTRRKLLAKVIHARLAADPQLVERMRLEAAAQGAVHSEYIVPILDFAYTQTGRPFLVMEFVEGRTLGDEIAASGPLHMLEAATFAIQMLAALEVVHEKGLVHRDIKPDNIMVCMRLDGSRCIKLLDFGVVRVMPGTDAVKPLPRDYRTRSGVVVGTPRFVSPEGAMGQQVDQRADLYAVGLVLYIMLVGRGPFDHFKHEEAVLNAHAVEDPEPPSRHSKYPVPPELDRALLKALAKDPSQRFQSATEFRTYLERVVDYLRRPAGWLETTAYQIPQGLDDQLDSSQRENASQPPAQGRPVDEVRASATPLQESAHLAADEPWRISTTTALLIGLVAFIVAGFAAYGLVSLLRGEP